MRIPVSVMVGGGVENFNGAVDKLVKEGLLKRILAQTDISSSNSMIETFFRVAKHNWLFVNDLDTIATVRRLIEFYITEHNTKLRHSALNGRTPDEVYLAAKPTLLSGWPKPEHGRERIGTKRIGFASATHAVWRRLRSEWRSAAIRRRQRHPVQSRGRLALPDTARVWSRGTTAISGSDASLSWMSCMSKWR